MPLYSGPVAPGANTAYFSATGKDVYQSVPGYPSSTSTWKDTSWTPQKPQVLGATTGPSGNNTSNTNFSTGINNIQNQGNDALDLINQDYENAIGAINTQEQGLRSQQDIAMRQADLSGRQVGTALEQQGATQQAGVQSQLSTAEKGAKTQTQQAQDLFRQIQQQNNSQLSAAGLSNSSVAGALAEKLGVETARRIAGITGSIEEVRTNATKEIASINNYIGQRKTEIAEQLQLQKDSIQSQFMNALAQLNQQKGIAATEKARGRAGILSQVQNNIYAITQQAQQYQQQLDLWAKQQGSKVYQSVGDLEQSLKNQMDMAQRATGITPNDLSFNTDQYGATKTTLGYTKPTTSAKTPLEQLLEQYSAPGG